ncbi:MAG: hypothetical protein GC206_00220 [Alphaproteobacteria bacterium]|nr:hypothetical protein [Alphaproteobacteria bacterium]
MLAEHVDKERIWARLQNTEARAALDAMWLDVRQAEPGRSDRIGRFSTDAGENWRVYAIAPKKREPGEPAFWEKTLFDPLKGERIVFAPAMIVAYSDTDVIWADAADGRVNAERAVRRCVAAVGELRQTGCSALYWGRGQ